MWGLYIHIPFCERRCPYCDFFSTEGFSEAEMELYCSYLLKEIEFFREIIYKKDFIQSIYIGGGTPSYAPVNAITAIVKKIFNDFPAADDCEVTIEVNPKSALGDNLILYHKAGINRMSVGAQSLVPEELRVLNRPRASPSSRDPDFSGLGADDIFKTVKFARKAGFTNICMDIMFGIPEQNLESLTKTLEGIIKIEPEHISAYSLSLEPGVPMTEMIRTGKLILPDNEVTAEMFLLVRRMLQNAGYEHYEISNYAKPGHRSRHNMNYWRRGCYYGFGLSAHSFNGEVRSWNTTDFNQYYAAVDSGKLPTAGAETLTPIQHINEEIMLSLRMSEGLSLREFEQRYGSVWRELLQDAIDHFIADNGSSYLHYEKEKLSLTEKGMVVSDRIIEQLIFNEKRVCCKTPDE